MSNSPNKSERVLVTNSGCTKCCALVCKCEDEPRFSTGVAMGVWGNPAVPSELSKLKLPEMMLKRDHDAIVAEKDKEIEKFKQFDDFLNDDSQVDELKNELSKAESQYNSAVSGRKDFRDAFKVQLAKNLALEKRLEEAQRALAFYASPASWCSDGFNFSKTDIIDSEDCSDYPHVTRDVKSCGGSLARTVLASISKLGDGEGV